MGSVYRTRHVDTDALYALKVLDALDGDEDALRRFRREAELMARVEGHRGCVRIHAWGVDDGTPWCAMEYIAGDSLRERIAAGPMRPEDAARVVAEVARAVAHLHRNGIIHRDVKPANVLVGGDGQPRLVDLGLARDGRSTSARLTRAGEVIGTPAYMAPEQVATVMGTDEPDDGVDERTDVYGLGALLYALVTGRPPFDGANARQVMIDVVGADASPARSFVPDLPQELDAICQKALEKVPEHRYPTAAAMADDLERWARGDAVSASMSSLVTRAWRRWRRRGSPAVRLGAALAMMVALVAAAAALGLWGEGAVRPTRSPLEALDAASAEAIARGRVPLDAVEAALEAARRHRDASLPALEAHAGLLAAVDVVLTADQRSDAERAAAGAVARIVRNEGAIDEGLMARARAVLFETGRLEALALLLHGSEPVAAARGEEARALARAIAERPGSIAVPTEETAFAALVEAGSADGEMRARLHLAHGVALAEANDPEGFDAALDALVLARVEHGVSPPRGWAWPAAFHARALDRFGAALRGDLPAARRLLSVLVRAESATHPLTVDRTVALQAELKEAAAQFGLGLGVPNDAAMERAILVGALLERWGRSPLGYERVQEYWTGVSADWLAARAERELALSPARRDPAVLVLLARFLLEVEWDRPDLDRQQERAHAWARAAEETGAEAAWLFAQLSYLYYYVDQWEPALEAARRAYALDRERPAEERWPLGAEILADLILEHGGAGDELDVPRDLAAIRVGAATSRQAARCQRAVLPLLDAIEKAGGAEPWMLGRRWETVVLLIEAAGALAEEDEPDCCVGSVRVDPERARDAPTAEELIAIGLALPLPKPSDVDEGHALLIDIRATHHRDHGRLEAALADTERSLALWERLEPWEDRAQEAARLDTLALMLEAKAEILRELEIHEEDAVAAEKRAAQLHAEVEKLEAEPDDPGSE